MFMEPPFFFIQRSAVKRRLNKACCEKKRLEEREELTNDVFLPCNSAAMETVRITISMPFSLKGTSLSLCKACFSSAVNCTGRSDSKRYEVAFFLATSSYVRMSFATRAARKRFSYLTDGRWLSTKDRTSVCNSSSVRWTNPVNFCQRSIQVSKSCFNNHT